MPSNASPTLSATTNNPVRARTNGRSAEGRRVRDLYKSFSATLGNPQDVGTQALVLAAAELVTAAERARRDHLDGRLALTEVVRVENLAARALRRIKLDKPAETPRKSFIDKLVEREAAARAAEAAAPGDGA
jgi:hypothetical protein